VQLGLIFAAAVSSIGVVLIVYMLLESRSRELNLMSIRGYQKYQLSISLITENIGMTIFASILGITIGVVNLLGQIEFYNKYIPSYTSWRLEFPLVSQVQLALLFTSIVLATIIPIELVVRKISKKPNIKGEG
jgi:ABC-type antimicrobial peptide transport system permease subunit